MRAGSRRHNLTETPRERLRKRCRQDLESSQSALISVETRFRTEIESHACYLVLLCTFSQHLTFQSLIFCWLLIILRRDQIYDIVLLILYLHRLLNLFIIIMAACHGYNYSYFSSQIQLYNMKTHQKIHELRVFSNKFCWASHK